jgi:hypothetical protein
MEHKKQKKHPDPAMDYYHQTKVAGIHEPTKISLDFCLMFMNSMEDGRRNQGSIPWTFKTQENPGVRPWPGPLLTVNTNSGFLLENIQ